MGHERGRRPRRVRRGIVALAAVGLVAGVWQGVAAATSTGHNEQAKIELGNNTCGQRTRGKIIGTVKFVRSGNEFTLTFS